MAEIQQDGGGGGKKGGKKRAKKQSTRIDMTPMVDLAFLLLTFFVLTSTFSKPKSMELTYPAPPPPGPPPPPVKNGITFILSKDDKIFYYEGEFRPADTPEKPKTALTELTFGQESLNKYLADKNKEMLDRILKHEADHAAKRIADTTYKRLVKEEKANTKSFTYLIKTDENATYKNVIDLIDQLNVNLVGKYVVVDMMKPELDLVNAKIGTTP